MNNNNNNSKSYIIIYNMSERHAPTPKCRSDAAQFSAVNRIQTI